MLSSGLPAARRQEARDGPPKETDMPNQLGKRYVCQHCATQLLVTKPGEGMLECHGEPMTVEAPKPLPASD
jgi:Desulfoferrodoxin, N-terminal domain